MTPHADPTWRAARLKLLAAEKAHMVEADRLAAERRTLPPQPVTEEYRFEGPNGPETLADLFGPHSQLAVYHFMFGADWAEGCPSCSFWADNLDHLRPHLAARDTSLVMIAAAPYATLNAYNTRMGWSHRWSSAGTGGFSRDFGVQFTEADLADPTREYNFKPGGFYGAEAPGFSTFSCDASGQVYFHYATFARGLDSINGAYKLLDLMPKGRDEDGLDFTMSWLKRRDQYPT